MMMMRDETCSVRGCFVFLFSDTDDISPVVVLVVVVFNQQMDAQEMSDKLREDVRMVF